LCFLQYTLHYIAFFLGQFPFHFPIIVPFHLRCSFLIQMTSSLTLPGIVFLTVQKNEA
jgi:hypothetical protein